MRLNDHCYSAFKIPRVTASLIGGSCLRIMGSVVCSSQSSVLVLMLSRAVYRLLLNQFLCERNKWDFYFQSPTAAALYYGEFVRNIS